MSEVFFTLEKGPIRLVVQAAPFAEIKLKLTFYKGEKLIDEYRSRGKLDFHSLRDLDWFIQKYAPVEECWKGKLLEWWSNTGWPQISKEISESWRPKVEKPVPPNNLYER